MKQVIPYLKILFSVTAWGLSFIATKVALNDVSPVMVVWLRFAIGIIVLFALVYLRNQLILPKKKDLGYLILLGLIGITFHQWLQSTGLITAEATTTAWIVATTPIFIALLGWLVLKETLKWGAVVGIFLAAIGVLLVVYKGELGSADIGKISSSGDLLILISAPNWAVFTILSKKGLRSYSSGLMILFVMFFGWLGTTIILFAESGFHEIVLLTQGSWIAIIFLGIGATGLAYIFWFDGLKEITVSKQGAFLYLEPLVTMVGANIILKEQLLLSSIYGGLIILLGVCLVNRSKDVIRT